MYNSVPQRYEEVPNGETLPLKVCKELGGKDHIGEILQVYIFILELTVGRVMPVISGTRLGRASVWLGSAVLLFREWPRQRTSHEGVKTRAGKAVGRGRRRTG